MRRDFQVIVKVPSLFKFDVEILLKFCFCAFEVCVLLLLKQDKRYTKVGYTKVQLQNGG